MGGRGGYNKCNNALEGVGSVVEHVGETHLSNPPPLRVQVRARASVEDFDV